MNSEEKIVKEERKIEKEEKKIRLEEKEIQEELEIVKHPGYGPTEDAQKFQNLIVSKLKKHRFIQAVLVTIGVVLVWRALWDFSERFIESSLVSLILGLILLWGLKKYNNMN